MATEPAPAELLARAQAARRALDLPNARTDTFRLVHGVADGLPDLTVDVYGEFAVASVYRDEVGSRERALFAALLGCDVRGVYLKHRPRQANELGEDERRLRAPSAPVCGDAAPESFTVHEHGVPYRVRLGDGLSTGLFLDQRENRGRVLSAAAGLRVLNLFSYTCAFGLAAATGGASSTTNIDVAKTALERGRENYTQAGITLADHRFLLRDVVDTLPRMARAGERYDLVVLDPPSYASTKRGRFSVERDYPQLVAHAVSVLAPEGQLLACTNHHGLDTQAFAALVRQGLAQGGRSSSAISVDPPPLDHSVAEGAIAHLKSAWLRVHEAEKKR